jgi:hypothetical protein
MMKGVPHVDPIPARQQKTEATDLHANIDKTFESGKLTPTPAAFGFRRS